MKSLAFGFIVPTAMVIFISGGCSKEKLDEMVSTVKEKATEVTKAPAIAKVLPPTGSAKIMTSPPVEISSVYAKLYVMSDGRPSIVQWTSYDPERGPNSYPALLVRCNTSAASITELAGQTLRGHVFLQAQSAGAVLWSPELVDFSVALPTAESKTLDASAPSLTLTNANGQAAPVQGITIQGIMP